MLEATGDDVEPTEDGRRCVVTMTLELGNDPVPLALCLDGVGTGVDEGEDSAGRPRRS